MEYEYCKKCPKELCNKGEALSPIISMHNIYILPPCDPGYVKFQIVDYNTFKQISVNDNPFFTLAEAVDVIMKRSITLEEALYLTKIKSQITAEP